ncbi:MAG: hypothetical protein EA407_06280 [Rhodobacteraceae bacterium]|nr:MAG: hypothetical protein EA407_06280 [Paracoccaceae bacterium]
MSGLWPRISVRSEILEFFLVANTPERQDRASGTRKHEGAALAGGAALTALSRAFAQFCQIVIFIYAARILGPEDFGLFALISAIAIVALKVAEAGWSEYIMAWSSGPDESQKVLGIACLCGVAMALVGIAAAAIGLPFFNHGDIPLLIAGFAIWILLATPSAAWNGIMIWQGRIMAFGLTGMAGEAVGLVVTLVMLSSGYGFLSLVGGRLAQQTVFVILVIFVTHLLPRFGGLRQGLPGLLSFSKNILASRIILVISNYASVFIVGFFLGPASVGIFRAAERVVGASVELIGEPVKILAWKTFRSVRDVGTEEAYQNFANVFFPLAWVIALPVFFWISLFSEAIMLGLLGPEWQSAAPVISIISMAAFLWIVGYATEPLLSLTGHASFLPRLFLFFAVVGIALVLAAGPFGVIAVAVAKVVAALVYFFVNLEVYRRKLGFKWWPVFRNMLPALIPLAVVFGLLGYVDQTNILTELNVLVRALIISLPAVALYLLLLAAFYRRTLIAFWRMMR